MTLVPTAWLLITTLTAGRAEDLPSAIRAIGFVALARKFSDAAAQGKVLAPAKSIAEMQRVAFNNYLDAVVCGFFVLLVLAMCVFALKICAAGAAAGAADGAGDSAGGRSRRSAGMMPRHDGGASPAPLVPDAPAERGARLRAWCSACRQVFGMPDYERYLAHAALRHPGAPVLTRAEHSAREIERRYGAGGMRCC